MNSNVGLYLVMKVHMMTKGFFCLSVKTSRSKSLAVRDLPLTIFKLGLCQFLQAQHFGFGIEFSLLSDGLAARACSRRSMRIDLFQPLQDFTALLGLHSAIEHLSWRRWELGDWIIDLKTLLLVKRPNVMSKNRFFTNEIYLCFYRNNAVLEMKRSNYLQQCM